jgi:hypothetical protein
VNHNRNFATTSEGIQGGNICRASNKKSMSKVINLPPRIYNTCISKLNAVIMLWLMKRYEEIHKLNPLLSKDILAGIQSTYAT